MPAAGGPVLRIRDWPASARLLLTAYLLVLLLVHAFALWEVKLQTGEVWTSASEYFSYMSQAKLVATTHNHLYGLGTLYALVGLVYALGTRHAEGLKLAAIAMTLGGAVADLGSWWGIKYVSPAFEYLSMACGAAFTLGFLFMAASIAKEAWAGAASLQSPPPAHP